MLALLNVTIELFAIVLMDFIYLLMLYVLNIY